MWSRLTAAISGFGIGGAASTVAGPIFEVPRQKAWQGEPNRILSLGDLAQLVATGLLDEPDAVEDARRNGFDEDKLRSRIQLYIAVPGLAELDSMANRGLLKPGQFEYVLSKHAIDPQFWPAIRDLLNEKLTPGELAAAIHRGLVPDPVNPTTGEPLLKGEQPAPPFKVEAYPVYPIPTAKEAAASGYDLDRLGVLVGLQGLPMGVIEAAHAYYRKIITHGDYIRAFNTSNSRNEWAQAVLEYARQIPTARDFFENALRGYHDLAWAQEQAQRHGMSPEDSLVIYQNQGRPMNIRQITQALARGAKFNPEPGELTDPYDAATVEGSVKPGYYELFKALKYTYPSPFVMRSLTESGVWSEAKAALRLKGIGWVPEDADEAAKAWAAGASGGENSWVKRAETQFWTTTHNSYKNGLATPDETRNDLAQLGVTGDNANRVMELWTFERDTWRKQLTPTQIKKAYSKAETNPATGQPWTRDDAIDRLIAVGYPATDAESLLDL